MTLRVEPFVFEVSTTIGTSDFSLVNQVGFRSFSSAVGTGTSNEFYYFIRHEAESEFEHGIGHIDTGSGDLVRDRVVISSNSNTLVNFSTGTKQITLDISIENIRKYDSNLATGLIDPSNKGILSINGGDSSKFDLSAGQAQIIDAFTDPNITSTNHIDFGPFTAQTITLIATTPATFVYIDENGGIIQKQTLQKGAFLRDHIGVGILEHPDNATITIVSGFTPVALSNTTMSFADLSSCQGAISCVSGGESRVTGNSGTLGLDKAQGIWYLHGVNVRNDPKNPNVIDNPALVKPVMLIAWRTTDNVNGRIIAQDTVPAGVYDDDTAVFADSLPQGTLTANQWVNHRLFYVVSTNQLAIQIGQDVYGSQQAAIDGISSEIFEILPPAIGATPLATVTMRGAASDNSDPNDASIRSATPPRATFI